MRHFVRQSIEIGKGVPFKQVLESTKAQIQGLSKRNSKFSH